MRIRPVADRASTRGATGRGRRTVRARASVPHRVASVRPAPRRRTRTPATIRRRRVTRGAISTGTVTTDPVRARAIRAPDPAGTTATMATTAARVRAAQGRARPAARWAPVGPAADPGRAGRATVAQEQDPATVVTESTPVTAVPAAVVPTAAARATTARAATTTTVTTASRVDRRISGGGVALGPLASTAMNGMPLWEQRLRAPVHFLPRWSRDRPDRCVYETNASGIWQVHVWDVATGERRQVSDHPVGVREGYLTPDASEVIFWQEDTGDETGAWLAQPFEGGGSEPFLDGAPRGWNGGIAQRSGV